MAGNTDHDTRLKLAAVANRYARFEAEADDLIQEGLIAHWKELQDTGSQRRAIQAAKYRIRKVADRRDWTGREGDDRKNGDVRLVSFEGMAEATGERDFTDLTALQEAGVRYDDEVKESEIDDAVPHAKGNKYGVFPVAVRYAPGFGPNGKEEGNAAE